jgi:hypothetical protein
MKDWSFTTIKHAARKELGVSPNEYCVLDYVYQTQVHPKYSRDGWCRTGIHVIAEYFGFSTGTVHKMIIRFVEKGLLEVDNADPRNKKTTPRYYDTAYLDAVQKVNTSVQKVNSTVQKVNENRSKSEHIIKEDNSKDNRENPPAQFLVTTVAVETIPTTNEGSALAESWRPAADHMIKAIEANPGALQYNLKGERPLPANWRESVRERMRHFQAQGAWFKITVPKNGQLRRWEAEMCAAIAKWIDSTYNTQPATQTSPLKTFTDL